jgi:hypothetical protein
MDATMISKFSNASNDNTGLRLNLKRVEDDVPTESHFSKTLKQKMSNNIGE